MSSAPEIAFVELFVTAFSKSRACASEDVAGAGVDGSFDEDASGVSGEAWVERGVISLLQS
jgi:hypothetical protein